MDRTSGGRLTFKKPKGGLSCTLPSKDENALLLQQQQQPKAASKTRAELGAQERFRQSVANKDQKKLLRAFHERLSRQSEHNDIPNV
jgi:hypothetical protein